MECIYARFRTYLGKDNRGLYWNILSLFSSKIGQLEKGLRMRLGRLSLAGLVLGAADTGHIARFIRVHDRGLELRA